MHAIQRAHDAVGAGVGYPEVGDRQLLPVPAPTAIVPARRPRRRRASRRRDRSAAPFATRTTTPAICSGKMPPRGTGLCRGEPMTQRSFAFRALTSALASAVLLAGVPMAGAHHSVAGQFDIHKTVTVSGVVSKVNWVNPHIYIEVSVKEPAATWRLEGVPVGMARKAGLSMSMLKGHGETVTIVAHPATRRYAEPRLHHQDHLPRRQGVPVRGGCCGGEGVMSARTGHRIGAWGLATIAACAVTGTWLIGTAAEADSSAAPAPGKVARLSDGHPDFNGSWDNGNGYDFIKPQKGEDGSICISGCKPAAAPAGTPPAPRVMVAPDRPKYKPEFAAKVADLEKRQVEMDPVIRCKSPGLPRIGPPDKIVQRPGQVVFLYDDVSGSFWRIIPTDGSKHREDADESYSRRCRRSLGSATRSWLSP